MTQPDPQYEQWGYQPRTTSVGLITVEILGRYPRVAPEAVEATKAMNRALIATGYENPCDWVGSWIDKTVSGTDQLSRHAYGFAIDLDYGGDNPDSPDHPGIDKNPHLHRPVVASDWGVTIQLLEHQVRAVESITTTTGKPVWRWLGERNGDAMHFDINVPPADLASGIHYEQGEPPMPSEQRYPDVPLDHLFHADIEWLAENEITKMPPGSLYRPEDPVTRGQIAAFLRRYHKVTTPI